LQDHKVILDRDDIRRTLVRIAHEIVEKNPPEHSAEEVGSSGEELEPVALVGIHRRGAILAHRLHALVSELLDTPVPLGDLDISFYRDDLSIRSSAPVVLATHLDFRLEHRTIVIVDDVLYTGRTVRAAIDAIFDYGRPARVQLAVLVDRGHRELPIRPDFVGKNIPSSRDERVNVRLHELDGRDEVTIGPDLERRRVAA
jgi:pyrimidine operon attenuation protein/uracil phosphoribosyltransferase